MRAVLFDLGETLYTYDGLPLSWAAHHRPAWRQALRGVGLDPTGIDLAPAVACMARYNTREAPRQMEVDSETIFAEALNALGLDQIHRPGIIEAYFTYFRQSLRPYAETGDVLARLHRHGVKTGALTDVAYGMPARFVADDLRRCGILLDVWFTSVQVGFRKPHPQGFLHLCAALAVAPDESLYVGNEEKDMIGARAAGLHTALVTRTRGVAPDATPAWGQDHTIADLRGCLDILGIAPTQK
jgi:putative hydrolase of the HAD superfamily